MWLSIPARSAILRRRDLRLSPYQILLYGKGYFLWHNPPSFCRPSLTFPALTGQDRLTRIIAIPPYHTSRFQQLPDTQVSGRVLPFRMAAVVSDTRIQ